MTVEYRVVVKTRHGTTHRWAKKGSKEALECARVYADAATPFYYGCDVTIERREVGEWHDALPAPEVEP